MPTFNPHTQESSALKVRRFRAWLRDRLGVSLVGDELIEHYIREAHNRGHARAFTDLRRADPVQDSGNDALLQAARQGFQDTGISGTPVPLPPVTQPYSPQRTRPSVYKVKFLAARTFHEMEGVTARMAADMSRTLAEAMARGWSPRRTAREMNKLVGIGLKRALAVVHTEMIRAHAEGQLAQMEEAGESEVKALVEWETIGDGRLCPACRKLQGKVFSLEAAKGLIPLHPNCRCAWTPARPPAPNAKRRVIRTPPSKAKLAKVKKTTTNAIDDLLAETTQLFNEAELEFSQWVTYSTSPR